MSGEVATRKFTSDSPPEDVNVKWQMGARETLSSHSDSSGHFKYDHKTACVLQVLPKLRVYQATKLKNINHSIKQYFSLVSNNGLGHLSRTTSLK